MVRKMKLLLPLFFCFLICLNFGCGSSGGSGDSTTEFPGLTENEKKTSINNASFFSKGFSLWGKKAPFSIVGNYTTQTSTEFKFIIGLSHWNRGYDQLVAVLYDQNGKILKGVYAKPDKVFKADSPTSDVPTLDDSFACLTHGLIKGQSYYIKVVALQSSLDAGHASPEIVFGVQTSITTVGDVGGGSGGNSDDGQYISIPELDIYCSWPADCIIGQTECSCQITDNCGGTTIIDGVECGNCDLFLGKEIRWIYGDEVYSCEIISSKQVDNPTN